MPASSSPGLNASVTPITHAQTAPECCPTCDQPIPRNRVDEISARIRSHQEAHESAVAARLGRDFAVEKAGAVEAAQREGAAALARERDQNAANIGAAQEQARIDVQRARQEAESLAAERIAELQRVSEQDKATADARFNIVQQQLVRVREDAATNEARIRTEEREAAEATNREQIAIYQRERQAAEAALLHQIADSDAAKIAAQETTVAIQARFDQAQRDHVEREAQAREEGKAAATAILQSELEQAQAAIALADILAASAVADHQRLADQLAASKLELESQKAGQDAAIAASVSEARIAMEADKTQAVNAAKAAASEDNRKMSEKLADLQRKLEQQTADQLGEGAEVDLYEDLKARFEPEGDKVVRVGKGKAGADVIHTVMHNGAECGKIIYDSKSHGQWRYDFSEKLAADKIAENADHAILSTRKFPEGMQQLEVLDGVILANPARVVALVHVVREHIVKSHKLRMSNEEKALKCAELYTFITSTQCSDLLDSIDRHAQELLDMQVKEQTAHKKVWKDQGILYRTIQKTGADLSHRIDIILGISGKADKAVNE